MSAPIAGACLALGASVVMFAVATYYTRRPAVAYRLDGAFALLCALATTGWILLAQPLLAAVQGAMALCLAWQWWRGGGRRDVRSVSIR